MKTFKKGFTLIELLIVIVIIGILAVGFAPTLLNAPKKARDGIRKGNIASIKDAIEGYALENNSQYPGPDMSSGCVTAKIGPTGPNGDISKYFQGSVIPKDPSSTTVWPANCFSPEYIYAKFDGSGCYVLGAKLEVADAGNSDKSLPGFDFCAGSAPTTGAGSKNYFYDVVKYK